MREHHIQCRACGCIPRSVGPGEECLRCGKTTLHYHCQRNHILCDFGCWPEVYR